MNKKFRVLIIGVWSIVLLLIGSVVTRYFDVKREINVKRQSGNWAKISLILDQIDKNYVDKIDYKKVTEEVLPYILSELDPHSVYLPPMELQSSSEELEGRFNGIGITFNVPEDTAVVINVIPGGPSERAGIYPGDRILEVDGIKVAGVKYEQDSLVRKMRGPADTKVNLLIKRGKESVPFEIIRAKIPVKSVDVAYMIDDTTAFLKLSKFTKTSYDEFVSAIKPFLELGMKRMIVDLRDNNGGYLDQALYLSNEFLKKGDMIAYMEGVHRPRRVFLADGTGMCQNISLGILIDENSASSSEIFAGAIQDNDRGTIYGRRSFGKGLVQESINFTDKSGIRLTVARYYTPTGRSIQKPYMSGQEVGYAYDILERYRHGEMLNQDSIPKNDSLKYITPGGKVVYGGGGIIPDVFVPIDTTDVTDLLLAINRQSLQIKFSISTADKYRSSLSKVNNLEELNCLLDGMDIEKNFIKFLRGKSIQIKKEEWDICKSFIITQIRATIGRYSPLEDYAFYSIAAPFDNVINRALKGTGTTAR